MTGILPSKFTKQLYFHKTKIFHYESSPIDDYEDYGLTHISDLKDEIIKTIESCKNYLNSYGGEFWYDMACLLLKRSLVEKWDRSSDFRDSEIWFYVDKVMRIDKNYEPTDFFDIENILLFLKEDNNGTCHLFSFFPLTDVTPLKEIKYNTRFVRFPNQTIDEWYYNIPTDQLKKMIEDEEKERIAYEKHIKEMRENFDKLYKGNGLII